MRKYITIAIIVLFSVACNSLDQYPVDMFTEETYWTSSERAMSVLNKAYNQMNNAEFNYSLEALTDNVYQRRAHTEKLISAGQGNAATDKFYNTWANCFKCIKTCHIYLENVDRVPDMSDELRERTKAEARFIRAYSFLMLATWYGDAPLFTTSISLEETKTISRTPHSEIIQFVTKELDEIAEILPKREEYGDSDKGRITAGAALALKARAYLFDNDWQNCLATCEKLMSNAYGTYSLYDSFSDLFTVKAEYCPEIILDIEYVPSLKTWDDYQDFMPPSVLGRVSKMAPTKELVDDFIMLNGKGIYEEGSGYDENSPYVDRDPRLDMTIVRHLGTWTMADGTVRTIYTKPGSTPSSDVSGGADEYKVGVETTSPTGYYFKKGYDVTAVNGKTSGMNVIVMRWADILLMYAESSNELGQFNESVWNNSIKKLRVRAGFPQDSGALVYDPSWSQSDLRTIIRRERRSELAFEGNRIFDIRRWKISEVVLNGCPHGDRFENNNTEYIQLTERSFNPDRDYLWPVPQSEKDINPNLGQNPGY